MPVFICMLFFIGTNVALAESDSRRSVHNETVTQRHGDVTRTHGRGSQTQSTQPTGEVGEGSTVDVTVEVEDGESSVSFSQSQNNSSALITIVVNGQTIVDNSSNFNPSEGENGTDGAGGAAEGPDGENGQDGENVGGEDDTEETSGRDRDPRTDRSTRG